MFTCKLFPGYNQYTCQKPKPAFPLREGEKTNPGVRCDTEGVRNRTVFSILARDNAFFELLDTTEVLGMVVEELTMHSAESMAHSGIFNKTRRKNSEI